MQWSRLLLKAGSYVRKKTDSATVRYLDWDARGSRGICALVDSIFANVLERCVK
jgi:hypothetical protein